MKKLIIIFLFLLSSVAHAQHGQCFISFDKFPIYYVDINEVSDDTDTLILNIVDKNDNIVSNHKITLDKVISAKLVDKVFDEIDRVNSERKTSNASRFSKDNISDINRFIFKNVCSDCRSLHYEHNANINSQGR